MKKVLYVLRLILGILFLFSGFVKAVDPLGLSYKMEEYLTMFQLGDLHLLKTSLAIVLSATEMFIGAMLLSGLFRRTIAVITFVFLSVFTIITYIIYSDPFMNITECGCFGDFVQLTNAETFYKNIVFLIIAGAYLWLVWRSYKHVFYKIKNSILSVILLVLCFCVPLYSYVFLPPFDFLPYNVGTKIDNDTMNGARINIYDNQSEDISDSVLINNRLPVFVVIAERSIDENEFEKLTVLHDLYKSNKIELLILTSSDLDNVKQEFSGRGWNDITIYYADKVMLKSLLRSSAGVVLINDGVIAGKWSLNSKILADKDEFDIDDIVEKERNSKNIYIFTLLAVVIVWIFIIFRAKRKNCK